MATSSDSYDELFETDSDNHRGPDYGAALRGLDPASFAWLDSAEAFGGITLDDTLERRAFMIAAGAAMATAAGAGTASASEVLNFSSEMVPDPMLTGEVTVGEVRSDMSMLEFIDDSDNVSDLADYGGMLQSRDEEDEPHNPVQISAGAMDADTYGAFPRDEFYDEDGDGDEDTEVSALDATHWTTDESASAGTITVADGDAQGGADGLRISTDAQADGDTASVMFNEFETIEDGVDRRVLQLGLDVDMLEAGSTVDITVHDDADGSKTVSVDESLTLDDDDIVADGEGEAFVYQMQLGDLAGDDLANIESIEVSVNDGDADVLVFFLDIERSSRIGFGTREVLDSDDELDTETIYEPSGWVSITELGTLDDSLDDATVWDVTYEVDIATSEAPTSWHTFDFEDAGRYDRDLRFKTVMNLDPPEAFDLVWSLEEFIVEQSHASSRYLNVTTARTDDALDLDDVDDDDVDWTDRSGEFGGEIGDEITLSTVVNADENTAIHYDILVDEDERGAMTGTEAAAGGPVGSSGGILDRIISIPGMIITGIIGALGFRRFSGGS